MQYLLFSQNVKSLNRSLITKGLRPFIVPTRAFFASGLNRSLITKGLRHLTLTSSCAIFSV